jgi:hypothetical protein
MGLDAMWFFGEAEKLGGIPAKVRLASLSRVTSAQAFAAKDDPELIGRLEGALTKVKGEFQSTSSLPPRSTPGLHKEPSQPARALDPIVATRLRRHVETFVDLLSQRAVVIGDIESAVRRVDEAASSALQVARVSIWMLDEGSTKITCLDLFDSNAGTHASGTELFAKDFPPYFKALRDERTIMAHNAHTDPRTSCFSKVYLEPLGIGSMLDVPIYLRGKMVGVVCHEHLGGPRTWDGDEERFAYLMANFVALAMERKSP